VLVAVMTRSRSKGYLYLNFETVFVTLVLPRIDVLCRT
jgi:hypothetical protein